jgi:hypothetical protein
VWDRVWVVAARAGVSVITLRLKIHAQVPTLLIPGGHACIYPQLVPCEHWTCEPHINCRVIT